MLSARSLLVVPLLALSLAACGSDEPGTTETSAAPSQSTTEPAQADGKCVYTEESSPAKDVDLPPAEPLAATSMTIVTNRGDITVSLDSASAPCTVSSFVSLARQGYFDDTKCHRLVPGFVLQCGDPSATGTGGPGYRFDDELSGEETYAEGTLAMANAGPNTNGSQFFIVLADAGLPPSYTVFGSVDPAGMEVAHEIEAGGNGADGVAPREDVVIEGVS
ncbi:MAG TPA: peptidylprolyl isomerase [Aeromicrobium sp.]|nr:peptidylprolyl isomerase [Aeromicrobium sp.]